MKTVNERLDNIEFYLANLDKMFDELNTEVLRQSKIIDMLTQQNKTLMEALKDSSVKPLSEETPPPHY